MPLPDNPAAWLKDQITSIDASRFPSAPSTAACLSAWRDVSLRLLLPRTPTRMQKRRGELLPVHAVAGDYRSRSHFEAQDYFESGTDMQTDRGWLNNVLTLMQRSASLGQDAVMVVSITVPCSRAAVAGRPQLGRQRNWKWLKFCRLSNSTIVAASI